MYFTVGTLVAILGHIYVTVLGSDNSLWVKAMKSLQKTSNAAFRQLHFFWPVMLVLGVFVTIFVDGFRLLLWFLAGKEIE